MTPRNLAVRDTEIREYMDDLECDPRRLVRTYQDFRIVNRLVSGWAGVHRRHILPLLSSTHPTSILDIGSGGGDIPRALAASAEREGMRLEITAIDLDPRAHRFALAHPRTGLRYRRISSAELIDEGARFDIVISNHLLHHLEEPELARLLRDSSGLARRLVIHNDIERGRLPYAVYGLATLALARRSFIHADGLRSIRRSYRADELTAAAGAGWTVQRRFPNRLLLIGRPTPGSSAEPEEHL